MSWPVGTAEATPDWVEAGEDIERRISKGEPVTDLERVMLKEMKEIARALQHPTAQEQEEAYLKTVNEMQCREDLEAIGKLIEKYGERLAEALFLLALSRLKVTAPK
ncbi:MAG: hypothetical protein Q8K32_10965 [Archangium sp.]|nr:hypothetical protein [Archangium sp.]